MTTQDESIEAALNALQPAKASGKLAKWMPLIERLVASGVTVDAIRDALAGQGLSVCTKTIRRALAKPKGAASVPAGTSAVRLSAASAGGGAEARAGAAAVGGGAQAPAVAAQPAAKHAPPAKPAKFQWPPNVDRANRWDPVEPAAGEKGEKP